MSAPPPAVPFPSSNQDENLPFPSSSSPSLPAPSKKPRPFATSSARAFSRSALSRQSVHTLPSIKHLQHGFAKLAFDNADRAGAAGTGTGTGAGAKSVAEMVGGPLSDEERGKARRRSSGIRRSLQEVGGGEDVLEEGDGEEEDEHSGLGPAPEKPLVDTRMPWEREGGLQQRVKTEQELRIEVLEGLQTVSDKWGLITQVSSLLRNSSRRASSVSASRRLSRSSYASSPEPSRSASPSTHLHPEPLRSLSPFSDITDSTSVTDGEGTASSEVPFVLDLLASTTSAIRSVQSYAVALPSTRLSVTAPALSTTSSFLSVSTAARPRTSLPAPSASSTITDDSEPLKLLRRKTLDVLILLREIEVKYRLPTGPSPPSSASTAAEVDYVHYSNEIILEAVLEAFPSAEEEVTGWIEAVSRVVSAASGKEKRMEERKARTSWDGSALSEEEEDEADGEEEEEVPVWADEAAPGGVTACGHALILAHLPYLPASLSSTVLPAHASASGTSGFPSSSSPSSSSELLTLLSSGHLLCHLYNAVLRHSSFRPFGFIPESSIHVVEEGGGLEGLGSEGMRREGSARSRESWGGTGAGEGEGRKVGGTFRRMENLRVFAAALKFRYSLPLHLIPPSSSSSASASTSLPTSPFLPSSLPVSPLLPHPSTASTPASVVVDPLLIARKDDGWETMLDGMLGAWVGAVGREWREERGM